MRTLIVFLLASFSALAQNPNVIFILADDLGHGDISLNDTFYSTPNIDSMANNGAYFRAFYTNPLCTPSRAQLMSSMYDYKTGLPVSVVYWWDERGLPSHINEWSLPNMMKNAGYSTAHFGKWHIGHAHPEQLPNARGFDYAFGTSVGGSSYFEYKTLDIPNAHENGVAVSSDSTYLDDKITDKVIQWISQQSRCQSNPPFFAWVSLLMPHISDKSGDQLEIIEDSLATAPVWLDSMARRRYVMLKNLDYNIGRIWQKVRDEGLEGNTVLIVTSDNGGDTTWAAKNTPYSGKKQTLWEGGIRVPFIWYQSGVVPQMYVDSVCGLVDIMPTLYEGVAERDIPDRVKDSINGVNFYPLLSGGAVDAGRWYIPSLVPGRRWAIIQHPWKLVNNPSLSSEGGAAANDIRLYNLQSDPTETTNVSATYPAVVTRLQAIITAESAKFYDIPVQKTEPVGWVDPTHWAVPKFFYDTSYYYYRGDR